MLVDKGYLVDADDPQVRVAIDRAEFNLEWDATRRTLAMPFQIVSGGNRLTLVGQANAPEEAGGAWGLRVSGGTVVLGPPPGATGSLVLNRIALNLKLDLAARRIDIEQGEIGNSGPRRRAVGQHRLFERRPAAGDRRRRHPHVGGGDEERSGRSSARPRCAPGSRSTSPAARSSG